jgi:hypothetical protein
VPNERAELALAAIPVAAFPITASYIAPDIAPDIAPTAIAATVRIRHGVPQAPWRHGSHRSTRHC